MAAKLPTHVDSQEAGVRVLLLNPAQRVYVGIWDILGPSSVYI